MGNNFKKSAIISTLVYPLSLLNQITISYYFGTSPNLDKYWSLFYAFYLLSTPIIAIKEQLANDLIQTSNYDIKLLPEIYSKYFYTTLLLSAFFFFTTSFFGYFYFETADLRKLSFALAAGAALSAASDILFTASIPLGDSTYHSKLRFLGVFFSIICVFSFYEDLKTISLAISTPISCAVLIAYCISKAKKNKLITSKYKFLTDLDLKQYKFSLANLLGISLILFLSRHILSTIEPSQASALQYAASIYGIPESIIITTIYGALWAKWSKQRNSHTHSYRNICHVLRSFCIIMLTITLIITTFSQPIISIFFERGAFDLNSTIKTANALSLYSLNLLPAGLTIICGRFISIYISKKIAYKGWILQNSISIISIIAAYFLKNINLVFISGLLGSISALIFYTKNTIELHKAHKHMHFLKTARFVVVTLCIITITPNIHVLGQTTATKLMIVTGGSILIILTTLLIMTAVRIPIRSQTKLLASTLNS